MTSDNTLTVASYRPVTLRQVEDWHKNYVLKQRYLANIMSGEVELGAGLDVSAFCKAYRLLVERIDILRSSFPKVDGEIVQKIEDYDPVKFAIAVDNRLDAVSRIGEFSKEKLRELKEIRRAPLLRAGLFNNNCNGYIFVFFIHHIISDAWSIQRLKDLLQTAYIQLLSKIEPQIQARDYTSWYVANRETIESEHRQTVSYWKEKLSRNNWHVDYDTLAASLVSGKVMRPGKTWRSIKFKHVCRKRIGSAYIMSMDPNLFAKLQNFKSKTRFGTFNILVACFILLSYKLTAVRDCVVQCTCVNRFDDKTTDLLGNLLGIVLLHVSVEPDRTVEEYLAQCYQSFMGSIRRILLNAEELEPFHLTTRSLLCLNYIDQTTDQGAVEPPSRQTHIDAESPLYCVARECSNTIIFRIEYRLEFYSDSMIDKFMDRYFDLLDRLMDNAGARIDNL